MQVHLLLGKPNTEKRIATKSIRHSLVENTVVFFQYFNTWGISLSCISSSMLYLISTLETHIKYYATLVL